MAERPIQLISAFGVVAAAFLVSTVYLQAASSSIEEQARQTETNALPSVEALSAARGALRHIDVGAGEYEDAKPDHRSGPLRMLNEARSELERSLQEALATPDYPEEPRLREETDAALGRLDHALAAFEGVEPTEDAYDLVHAEIDVLDGVLVRLEGVNAAHGRDEIRAVLAARRRAYTLALVLNTGCVLVTAVATALTVRASRKQEEAEAAREHLLVDRAKELEMFAKRVAHDLLSPLTSLSFVLSSTRRAVDRGEPPNGLLDRADASIRRARQLVDGALDYARSGTPHPRAVADVQEAIHGALDEAKTDDKEPTEVVVEPFDPVRVQCAPGVLASVLGNLVRNALKYMDTGRARVLTLRVKRVGEMARVEVADTGPGLPKALEGRVFEEYVRAPDDPRPGLGLGLATVRRFVEAHAGRVGVESSPQGATFWFELPVAAKA